MTDNIKKFLTAHSMLILPYMLSVVLSFSMYAVYVKIGIAWVLGILAVTFITFAVGEFVNKHNFAGAVILIIIIFACLYFFFMLISGNDYGSTFQRWMLTGSDEVDTRFEYLLALLISFVPFYAICIYYFTKILYRMAFLTLVSIIPCALYVKVLSEINNLWLALIALLNVVIFLMQVRHEEDKDRRVIGAKSMVVSVTAFTFALLAVSAAIPKEDEARYYDRFEELFMDSDMQTALGQDFANFAQMSGNADNYRNFKNRRMYTITGSYAPYFKRQTFDEYDFELDAWRPFDNNSDIAYTSEEWYENRQFYNLSVLQSAMRRCEELSPGFAEKYSMTGVTNGIDVNDKVNTLVVSSENFGAMYLLSPARIIDIRTYMKSAPVYVTKDGVFRFKDAPHPPDFAYTVEYYDEVISRGRFISENGSSISNEDCEKMLTEMKSILSEGDENSDKTFFKCVDTFLTVHKEAMDYNARCTANNSLISDEIHTLAEEITAGMEYDYEKAAALAGYFIKNGYTYDLRTIAPDTSPEYFLFESKRGSCSDYASAFVLMARSVGLTVRYCEGFSPELSSRENVFIIKDSDSHAYAEVYLQNQGWQVFESTVPGDYNPLYGEEDTSGNQVQLKFDTDLISVVLRVMGVVLAFVMIGVFCIPFFDELMFRRKLKAADPESSALMIYSRLAGGKANKILRNIKALTVYEFTDKLTPAVGYDSTPLAFIIERFAYGGERLNETDKTKAVEIYEKLRQGINDHLNEKAKRDRISFRDKFGRKKNASDKSAGAGGSDKV